MAENKFADDRQLTVEYASQHPDKVKRLLDADQTRITDLSSDSRLTDAAEKIIDSGSCAVSKPVRAGFTTSAIYACERKGLKLLVLEPTTRLLKETISKASNGDYIRVTGNSECPIQEKEARQNKILKKLPFVLPDCTKCKMYKTCPVLEIHRVDDFNVVGLTYAKLESLMLSNGKMAKDIIQKIRSVDVVLLDEAHLLSLPTPPSVAVFASVNLPDGYKMLVKILAKWLDLCENHITEIQELLEKSKLGFASQYLSIHAGNPDTLSWKDLKVAWAELRKLAITKELPNNEILLLRDIITILASANISLNFISESGTEGSADGRINITASHTRQGFALNDFLRNKVPYSTHLYGSGTMFEPYPGFFTDLSGKEIRSAIFPDIRNATPKMTLIPDKRKLRAWDFSKDLKYIVEMIKTIADREKQPIYVLCPNRAKRDIIKAELVKMGIQNAFIDYFRSDYTLGVERTERVCVSIGMADTPANSCDAAVYGARGTDDKWIQSRKLRQQCVDSATWQAVNRVKDPKGEQDSRVYFVGSRLDRVKQVARWGINRTIEVQEIREDTYTHKNQDGIRGTTYTVKVPALDVHVDQELELPKIQGETKLKAHSDRRSVSDYIKKIESTDEYYSNLESKVEVYYFFDHENIEEYASNSKKEGKKPKNMKKPLAAEKSRNFNTFFSTIYYRENGMKLPIFNSPKVGFQQTSTMFCLYTWFVNRIDHYGLQYFNPTLYRADPKNHLAYGFWKKSELTETILKSHVLKHVTMGVYQIALEDDTVIWCAVDIDSHHGETDSKQKVTNTCAILRNYDIPFLLEGSGSPDSYHIWILLAPTKTRNAFKFIRQIVSEAKLPEGTECFPKQQSLKSDKGKFGNLIKLPICLHKKTGCLSQFLDSDTFEPLEGPIFHPGLVHLIEIPDPNDDGTATDSIVMPKLYTAAAMQDSKAFHAGVAHTTDDKQLDYCMQRSIEAGDQWEGGDGNDMRVAVAVKAKMSGMTIEETIDIFRKSQVDFREETTRKYVEYAWNKYDHPHSCKKLRSKCGRFVKPWCPTCHYCPKTVKAEAITAAN